MPGADLGPKMEPKNIKNSLKVVQKMFINGPQKRFRKGPRNDPKMVPKIYWSWQVFGVKWDQKVTFLGYKIVQQPCKIQGFGNTGIL